MTGTEWIPAQLRCPRCGGSVMRERVPGSATDPNDPLPSDHHFYCSPCGKLWHPIEMSRRSTAVFTNFPQPQHFDGSTEATE